MKLLKHLTFIALLFAFGCGGGGESTEDHMDENMEDHMDDNMDNNMDNNMDDTTMMDGEDSASKDIVAIAMETESLSTLVAALQAADLVGTLQGAGPFTVFAPTNEAFAALPEGTLDELLKPENKERLVAILTYHVVSGEVMSSDLTDGMTATVNGAEVTVNTANGAQVNGANVVTADVDASNGVVHVIDAVILPPTE